MVTCYTDGFILKDTENISIKFNFELCPREDILFYLKQCKRKTKN